jgi:acyl-CoA thioester hydrolase
VKKDGIKYVFTQNIYRASDDKLVLKATVDTVCLINGRLKECQELDDIFFGPYSEYAPAEK